MFLLFSRGKAQMFTCKRFPCFKCSRNGVHNLVGALLKNAEAENYATLAWSR
jgi:hypothetical protein